MRSRGATDIGSWNRPVAGRTILLLELVAVSPLRLETVAEQLRRRGALAVHACGVDVVGGDAGAGLDSFQRLKAVTTPRAPSFVSDAA